MSEQRILEGIVRRRNAAVAAAVSIVRHRGQQNTRRMWSRFWPLRRDQERSVLSMVFSELRPEDPSSFTNYTRMESQAWRELLVTPYIQRQNTNMREAISPRDRLSVTLRYLATGNTFKDLSYSTRIAPNTISKIVDDCVGAIINILQDHICLPSTKEAWEAVAHRNEVLWNFPNCVGALDGNHVAFRAPRSVGSSFRNYKGTDSIVLFALVGPDYKFMFVDIGRNGRMHEAAVFQNSLLGEKLEAGTLDLPPPSHIPGFPHPLPYVVVGDDAFPLKKYLMKPYPERGLTLEKKIF